MSTRHAKSPPRPTPGIVPEAPTEALERPQALKKWSGDLVRILDRQKDSLFEDWDFRPADLTKVDFTRILKKVHGCGSVVELRAKVDRGTGEVGLPAVHAANFCGQHTICPFCAGRVQDRRKARFRDPIMAAAREYKYAYLVTATIPPVPTWREDLKLLMDSWQSFRRMGQVRRRKLKDGSVKETRSGGEWGKVLAGISKIELKRGAESGLPHCHVHALFFTDEYLDFRVWSPEEKQKARADRRSLYAGNGSKISIEWQAATDGKATGIDIRKIKWRPPKRHKGEKEKAYAQRSADWSLSESIFEQAREVLKYATKFDSSPETGAEKLFARDFVGIKSATYGRRLFQTYGSFRKVGGSDFEGGTCPISENPLIYETRWRSDRYGPLVERTKPVFSNREPGPGLTHRLQVLNRVQGATRRIRRAINESKRLFLTGGILGPAEFSRREYLVDGGFLDYPSPIEVPAAVAADPYNMELWEAWIDAATEAGRSAYSEARSELDGESHLRIIGTIAERQAEDALERRAFRMGLTYEEHVVREFMKVLAPSSGPP